MYTNSLAAGQVVNKFTKEEELHIWSQYEDHLKREVREFECGTSEREAEEEFGRYTEEEEAEILVRIDELKRKLLEVGSNNSLKELLLTNVKLAASFKEEATFPREHISPPSELLSLASTRDELAINHLKLVEEITKGKEELLKLQLANQDILTKNRLILGQATDLELGQYDPSPDDTTDKVRLKEIREKFEISRNVLQSIILASGVDWSSDEHLVELMLLIGDEPQSPGDVLYSTS
ncbi:hypothetical protein K493DRAFT_407971 [Basidiobolus meristosporus CBS 931.73]|uniref:Centromere protein H C-terminal domain-containing protein n=1 Tax=Basidiobolus meristosporus CBS 931.73 TaxID=1314790 RepID=A0A1Y1Y8Z8_9FUNG|nr:hypothetical protein K493DRAFT_407971 [Basidiobolus meristosporus CBS 931.73]|eukprot:ORX94479.1 hypothetical protein K493DRAFT_407971 [Basidiobolus meristosporus CBS 931.73]